MTMILPGILFLVGGCRASTNDVKDCCGLTAAQWKAYNGAASNAVQNVSEWKRLSIMPPSDLRIDSPRRFSGSTNSEDGEKPPTEVEIDVPVTAGTNRYSHVVVKFRHPAGEIIEMYATTIIY